MGFIEQIAPMIQQLAPKYGIAVCSPIIAQAVLESASGTSELARNAHNYFGLKYRSEVAETSYVKVGSEQNPDGSYSSGVMFWCKFPNMLYGVKGYFDFISRPRYENLKGITDPKTYLETIKADGYATSLKYVDNLMNVIKKYDLTQYDKGCDDMKRVAIDAGHGSNTAGKRTPDGFKEHWINVKCAMYCEEALKRCGIDTFKIAWDDSDATDDPDVALATRQAQIKAANCDISVSFHANAYGSGWNAANGVETLISNTSAGDSLRLATLIQKHLVEGTKQSNRGVKKQSLAMCRCDKLGVKAACLMEIGFMTNKYESDLMKTDAFCKEQAEEVAHGICDYLGVKYVTSVSVPVTEQKPQQSGSFLVQILVDDLNIRGGAGTTYPVRGQVKKGIKYTIVETKGSWGKLKSGAGWINISSKYVKKV